MINNKKVGKITHQFHGFSCLFYYKIYQNIIDMYINIVSHCMKVMLENVCILHVLLYTLYHADQDK
jgi:hypothetical protein